MNEWPTRVSSRAALAQGWQTSLSRDRFIRNMHRTMNMPQDLNFLNDGRQGANFSAPRIHFHHLRYLFFFSLQLDWTRKPEEWESEQARTVWGLSQRHLFVHLALAHAFTSFHGFGSSWGTQEGVWRRCRSKRGTLHDAMDCRKVSFVCCSGCFVWLKELISLLASGRSRPVFLIFYEKRGTKSIHLGGSMLLAVVWAALWVLSVKSFMALGPKPLLILTR